MIPLQLASLAEGPAIAESRTDFFFGLLKTREPSLNVQEMDENREGGRER